MLLPLLIFDNELTEIYLTLTYKNEQTTADEIVTDKYITESTRVSFRRKRHAIYYYYYCYYYGTSIFLLETYSNTFL